ncbi:hypothetical protein [Pseudomonas syringae]|uniref:hypothetical protein n=1 Tax=Pseudomonas syringae TaxID=317 RepID=UPI004032C61C
MGTSTSSKGPGGNSPFVPGWVDTEGQQVPDAPPQRFKDFRTSLGRFVSTGDGDYPLSNQIGIDAMAQGYAGYRNAWLQAFLNDLGFNGFGIRSSFAHENPDDKGNGVHVFLSGEHRPYCSGLIGDLAGRLRIIGAGHDYYAAD